MFIFLAGQDLIYLFVFCFQVEVKDDEEQNKKFDETVQLLLAAGYFRARIKGLSPFDKVRIDIYHSYVVTGEMLAPVLDYIML